MLDTDSDDCVDKSAWLPDGEPLLTPERQLKGDMHIERRDDGEINYARASAQNILNYLWRRDVLTNEQLDAGWLFKAWRDQHRVSLGLQRAVSNGERPESLGIKLRAYGYVLIVTKLDPASYASIDHAVETDATYPRQQVALRNALAYRIAFLALEKVLPPIQERIGYLEGISEGMRSDMSASALKQMLDDMGKQA